MTYFIIALFALAIILLSIFQAIVSPDKHPKLRRSIAWIEAVVGVLTLVLSLLTTSIPEPVVFPLNGMLTEDHPEVRIVNDEIAVLGSSYYSEDGNSFPVDSGTKYVTPFIPDHSGIYYAQSRFLWKKSKVVPFTVITYVDSIAEHGQSEDQEVVFQPSNNSFWQTAVSDVYTSDFDNLPEGFASGWGDNMGGRSSYSIQDINEGKLHDQIIFDTITDSPSVGDEKGFTQIRESYTQNYWKTRGMEVEIGKEYTIRLYVHNNSPWGMDKIAEDVQVKFEVPEGVGRSFCIHGWIASSNATPSEYWNGVILTNPERFHLEYVEGSALINGNGKTGGTTLPDSIVNNWVMIGYDDLDGKIPGCFQYSQYVTIKVRIVGET